MSAERELLGVSDAWDAALVANDADAVAAFMADDWVFVGPTGVTTKRELVGWIATGRLAHHSIWVVGAPRVAIHGATAILTARKASSGTWDAAPYEADEWISEVYLLREGRWSCVLSHKAAVE